MRTGAQTKPRKSGDALRAYALQQIDDAGRALGSEAARLHVGIHEARKAMRRARSAVDLGAAIAGFGAEAVSTELQLLCRRLSAARDSYIVVKTVEKLARVAGEAHAAALRRVRDRFVRRHQRAITRLQQVDPGMRQLRGRLGALRARIAVLPWSAIGEIEARAAIAMSTRKVERAARAARAEETGDARHRWRRRLRRLRYQIEIAEGELGFEAASAAARILRDPSAARIAKMTDLLGDENDLCLVLAALDSPRSAAPPPDFVSVQRLLQQAIAERSAALRP